MKVKVKVHDLNCSIYGTPKGEWIDLRAAQDYELTGPKMVDGEIKFYPTLISLGVSMQLPKGFEAIIAPRSSTFKSFGMMQANSIGIIDNSYCSNSDIFRFLAIPFRDCEIWKGDRICQFRIQPSQKSSIWVKLKWLFSNSVSFEYVDNLEGKERGGFGTTGKS